MSGIGIYGGTFDPIHNAHIKLALTAYNELGLEKVIFVPAYIPPHKMNATITDEAHRFIMTELAIDAYPYFEVSDMEIKMEGASYTARTLEILKNQYDNLIFILGADSYMALESWYHPEKIFANAEIACAVRDDVDIEKLEKQAEIFKNNYNGITHVLHMDETDISSHEIRKMISAGRNVSEYIPQNVYEYIKEHGLYEI